MAYVDLYAGRGRYEDGYESTPLLVVNSAINQPQVVNKMAFLFNDIDETNVTSLKGEIESLPGYSKLTKPPIYTNLAVGDRIVTEINKLGNVPIFLYLDPWGYRGLTLRLISSILRGWGSEVIFFFNFSRINSALSNVKVARHMHMLFGSERAKYLKAATDGKTPFEREDLIIDELQKALKDAGANHVLPFSFKDDNGRRTKQHLVFATKNQLGFRRMKDVMGRWSSPNPNGTPSYQYTSQLTFGFDSGFSELIEQLISEFSGKTIFVDDLISQHHTKTKYREMDYKATIKEMEARGLLKAVPSAEERRKDTLADDTLLIFGD